MILGRAGAFLVVRDPARLALVLEWLSHHARRNGAAPPPDVAALIGALREFAESLADSGQTIVEPCARGAQSMDLTVTVGVSTAARRLGVSQRTLRRRLLEGTFPGRRDGARWLIELPIEETQDRAHHDRRRRRQ